MMDNFKELVRGAAYIACTGGTIYVTLVVINNAVGVGV
jgi:hypothetical protein|tara:strand:- start:1136 stop:1249 length:114 start_codon:yes stop_codon:yes gene_type:complete